MLESVRNITIYNVNSRIYYRYFTFKGLDYTRNIVVFLKIFFQRSIFRKLTIAVISSSQWNVVSTFWVIWENVRCRLMKPLIFGYYTKIINYAFHFTFFKNVSVSFAVSSTIKRNITLHERTTNHLWFIETWRINGISFSIWWNSFTFCIFRSKYILTVVVTAWHFFISSLVNCEQPSKKSGYSLLTTILTRSTDIKKLQLARMLQFFSKVVSFSQLLRRTIFCLK